MPKAKVPSVTEGDVLKRNDLIDLKNKVEDIHKIIDHENIRQEGLDRRVFKNRVHSSAKGAFNQVYGSGCDLERKTTFTAPEDWDTLENSAHAGPEIQIPWNPETDTHAIVRVSLFIDTRNTESKVHMPNDCWDFGLMVRPPVSGSDYAPLSHALPDGAPVKFDRTPTALEDRIWPYQRVQLNLPFSGGARWGQMSYGEAWDDCAGDDDEKEIFGFGKIDGERGGFVAMHKGVRQVSGPFWSDKDGVPFYQRQDGSLIGTAAWDRESSTDTHINVTYHEKYYPRGDWWQHQYDRSSNMNASITLIAHITSRVANSGLGCFRWTEEGTGRIGLFYRCFQGNKFPMSNGDFYMGGTIKSEHVEDLDCGVPRIESLRMQYQIIRR